MNETTLYTAVGHFRRRTDEQGRSYPVVLINRQEYLLDLQEMTVWTTLNWRLLDLEQLAGCYDALALELRLEERRTLEDCVKRLVVRGLVAAGTGGTDFEAMYDLLANLYIVPISESLPLRLATFCKLVLRDGVPVSRAKQLFQRNQPEGREAQVMALSRQALLSTAELIKCVEVGATDLSTTEKVMDALYSDEDTTSNNIGDLMRNAPCRASVTMAVANLFLHKQIIFERVLG